MFDELYIHIETLVNYIEILEVKAKNMENYLLTLVDHDDECNKILRSSLGEIIGYDETRTCDCRFSERNELIYKLISNDFEDIANGEEEVLLNEAEEL